MRRYTIVFALLSAAAAALYALGTADLLPLNATGQAAVTFLMPGFWLRGLASGTELGFQDWRDVALTVFGAAGCLTLAFIVLDQAWTRWRRRSARLLPNVTRSQPGRRGTRNEGIEPDRRPR